ncbi:MAG: hypothetical protein IJZ58_02545, partial [Oscillospiraceae bacterium]|nr:hypothetical protein [Oscillospiraceae bacterium]
LMLNFYNNDSILKKPQLCKITFCFKVFAFLPLKKAFEKRSLCVLPKGDFCFKKPLKKLCSKQRTKGRKFVFRCVF